MNDVKIQREKLTTYFQKKLKISKKGNGEMIANVNNVYWNMGIIIRLK